VNEIKNNVVQNLPVW